MTECFTGGPQGPSGQGRTLSVTSSVTKRSVTSPPAKRFGIGNHPRGATVSLPVPNAGRN
eukprot:1309704-Pyramimonas_sp.AAC.1